MPFPPSGEIYLIGGLLIDNTYEHTVLFSNQTEQVNWFTDPSRVRYYGNEYKWMRKDQSIKVDRGYDDLWDVNYVLYRNGATDKWIFHFVTDKTYTSDGTTELIIETDVLNTYMFDYTINPSFIEREHQDRWASVGNPILNYVEESLAYGDEYVKQHEEAYRQGADLNIAWFLVVSTTELTIVTGAIPPTIVQGTPSPLYYYLVPIDRRDSSGSSYNFFDGSANEIMNALDFSNYLANTPGILSMSYIPYLPFVVSVSYVGFNATITVSGGEWISLQATTTPVYHILRLNTDQIDAFDSFIIGTFQRYSGKSLPGSFAINQPRDEDKESKLLTFPYCYNLLTDGQSTPLMIKNEYVETNTEFVRCSQSMNINPKTKYFIDDYRGESNGKTYNIINTSVNDLPLTSDAYKDYLSQNKASATTGIGLGLISGVASLGIGIASGGVALPLLAGAGLSTATQIGSELAKRKDLQTTPDNLRNSGNNIAFSFVDDNIDLRHMRYEISDQYKKILADYWAMFGYKCNELKTPNIKSRYYYNYIKCYVANITGDIDMIDLQKIKNVFENGVTFWHYNSGDPLDMLSDYQYDNVERSLLP